MHVVQQHPFSGPRHPLRAHSRAISGSTGMPLPAFHAMKFIAGMSRRRDTDIGNRFCTLRACTTCWWAENNAARLQIDQPHSGTVYRSPRRRTLCRDRHLPTKCSMPPSAQYPLAMLETSKTSHPHLIPALRLPPAWPAPQSPVSPTHQSPVKFVNTSREDRGSPACSALRGPSRTADHMHRSPRRWAAHGRSHLGTQAPAPIIKSPAERQCAECENVS